jgi:hypothetical protein
VTRINTIILFLFIVTISFSQRSFRAPIWFPADTTTIAGLSLELNARGNSRNCFIIGVNFEFFGLGILMPLAPGPMIRMDKNYVDSMMRIERSLTIHGINISPFGTWSNISVNGLNINGICSYAVQVTGIQTAFISNSAQSVNGLQLAGLVNEVGYIRGLQLAAVINVSTVSSRGLQIAIRNRASYHQGIQIGLFNRSDKLKGIQIGLWNRNDKRKLPLINW